MRINPDCINSISDNLIEISGAWAWTDTLAYSPRYTETFSQPISLEATTLDFLRFKSALTTITIRATPDPLSTILWTGISYNIPDDGNDVPTGSGDQLNVSTGCVSGVAPEAIYGVGTITIADSYVNLCSVSDFMAPIVTYFVHGATFTLTDNTEQYLVADYNNGSPIYRLENNKLLINDSSIVLVRVCWRQGNNVHSIDTDCQGLGLANKLEAALISTTPYKKSVDGGMILSETSTPTARTVLVSAATVFAASTPHVVAAFNSSVNQLTFVRHVAGVWTYSDVAVYNNSQYDDGTNLVALTTNKYTVNWIYRSIGSSVQCFFVLGNAQYSTVAQAQTAPQIAVPLLLRDHCMLVGRIIVQQGAISGFIENVSDTSFSSGVVGVHNDLGGLQGTGPEYYHFSNAQYTDLTDAGDSTLHYHASDRKPENIPAGYTTNPWYLNTHPEGNGVTVPFINNDLAHLIQRGGAMTSYYTTDSVYTALTLTNTGAVTIGTSAPFDGSPSYSAFTVAATSNKVVIDIDCPTTFAYSTTLYVDFGNYNWQARDVTFLAYQSVNNSETVYKVLGSTTSNYIGRFAITGAQYTYINTSAATGYGFNKLRIVLSTFTNTTPRIACIGVIGVSSAGLNNVYLSRSGANMYGSINPNTTLAYSLGSNTNRWLGIYAGTFYENGATLASTYQLLSAKNVALGYAGLDASAKVPISLLPDVVVGQLHYQGVWDASTNTPALPVPSSNKGMYYIVSVAGTTTIANCSPYSPNSDWKVGDWLVSDGTYWDKIDNTDAISSWNGRVGAITPIKADYSTWFVDLSGSYANPSWITSLDATKITTSTTLQFVSDTEKSSWNSKQPGSNVLSSIATLTTGTGLVKLTSGAASLDTTSYMPYYFANNVAVDFNTANALVNYDGIVNVFGSSYTNAPSGLAGGGGGGTLITGYGANAGSWQTQLFVNGQQDRLQFRVQGNNTWAGGWHTVWHDGNLTNLNQLTNGPGYITSSALSPYLLITGGTGIGNLTGAAGSRIVFAKDFQPSATINAAYNSTPLLVQRVASSGTTYHAGIGFENSGVNATVLYLDSSDANLKHNTNLGAIRTLWDSGNLTNLNQLTNGPGYITSSALSPYLPLAGGTMAASTAASGGINWASGGSIRSVSSADAANQSLIVQGSSLRLGASSAWDYAQWCGIKYDHSSLALYIGGNDSANTYWSSSSTNAKISVNFVNLTGYDSLTVNGQKVWNSGNLTSSNLPGGPYLPLTAGSGNTLTGTLYGAASTFTGTVTAGSTTQGTAFQSNVTLGTGTGDYAIHLCGKSAGVNNAVIFTNGPNRTADGGANTTTWRSDIGGSVFGNASFATTIAGSAITLGNAVTGTSASFSGLITSNTQMAINKTAAGDSFGNGPSQQFYDLSNTAWGWQVQATTTGTSSKVFGLHWYGALNGAGNGWYWVGSFSRINVGSGTNNGGVFDYAGAAMGTWAGAGTHAWFGKAGSNSAAWSGFLHDGNRSWLGATSGYDVRLDVNGIDIVTVATGSVTFNANLLNLNAATSNLIAFNTNGVAAPAFTSRSAGTKIVLYPAISSTLTDYAFGIEVSALWSSVPDSTAGFKWYAGTTSIASLSGVGLFATSVVKAGSNGFFRDQVGGGSYTTIYANAVGSLSNVNYSFASNGGDTFLNGSIACRLAVNGNEYLVVTTTDCTSYVGIYPKVDSSLNIGSTSAKWLAVYANSGIFGTSSNAVVATSLVSSSYAFFGKTNGATFGTTFGTLYTGSDVYTCLGTGTDVKQHFIANGVDIMSLGRTSGNEFITLGTANTLTSVTGGLNVAGALSTGTVTISSTYTLSASDAGKTIIMDAANVRMPNAGLGAGFWCIIVCTTAVGRNIDNVTTGATWWYNGSAVTVSQTPKGSKLLTYSGTAWALD